MIELSVAITYLIIGMCVGCRTMQVKKDNDPPWIAGVLAGIFWPLFIMGEFFFT